MSLGKIVFYLEPDYPPEAKAARVGGTVVVKIKLNEKGSFPEIENVAGHKLLQAAAIEAARKVKFTPTVCDGVSVAVKVTMNYNFIAHLSTQSYFNAAKIEDFPDIKPDAQFYEAILDLTENHRVAFGYGDRNFYSELPLTRGDLAHFLRLTLDLLSERAKISGKLPREIRLFSRFNPQNLNSPDKIKALDKKAPYLESIKILLLKYDIAFVDEKKEFRGAEPVTQNEAVDLWTKIFGAEAIPVNFNAEKGDRILTRGEFALFLQESMGVLTYKVLP
ncbi:MAG TPA: TonB family protein [Pyrinomonadaceae bacterium]|nr:TonB family protein [Pyrinomonadaceae bacterium]